MSSMDNSLTRSRSDVDDIIRKKRKIREHKACYPCRQRKVRCDSNVPCKTCVERNHADICSWNPPSKQRDETVNGHTNHEGFGKTVTVTNEDWERICGKLNAVEQTLSDLRHELRNVAGTGLQSNGTTADSPASTGTVEPRSDEFTGPGYVKAMDVNEQNRLTGETVHLGGGSVPALIKALRQSRNGVTPAIEEVFGSNVLPLFGLDNENATYPFVSLWGAQSTSSRVSELHKALPNDAECLETFRQYRDGAYVTFPGCVDIDRFENEVLVFLSHRRSGQDELNGPNDSMCGKSLHWVALLFAVLASGSQFSGLEKRQRDLISQVYGCCSFECLRLVNYLANASLEIIQAMLVLGNVLANSMNAGAAWAFLGTTMRLAQSLGLHRSASETAPDSAERSRSKTWWAIIWQDSLLSISYDRASSAATADCPPPPHSNPSAGYTYHETMYRVCKVGLDCIRNRVIPQSIEGRLSKCVDLREEIQRACDNSLEHLRELESCKSIKDQSEYWMLHLHTSYMKSELCRPAISPTTADFDKTNELRRLCVENLTSTVQSFLGLSNVSPIHIRSWAVLQRALSAALLLGILGEPPRDTQCQNLLTKLIGIMSSLLYDSSELSAPIERSISALRKLCNSEPRFQRPTEEQIANTSTNVDSIYSFEVNGFNNGIASDALNLQTTDDSFSFPSPLTGVENDSSPHALIDSIIFGTGGANTFG